MPIKYEVEVVRKKGSVRGDNTRRTALHLLPQQTPQ
jgi:hypothetical protein